MNRCVNINHPEFKELLNQSELDPISLAADVSIWQDRNDTDLFPTIGQLNPEVLYQKDTDEGIVASEKTIRDLAARMSDRIGIPVRFISDRNENFKGKLESGVAVVNLAYASLDTPIHEILGHPIIRALKGSPELRVGDKVTYSTILGDKTSKINKIEAPYTLNPLYELEDGKELEGYELTKVQSPLFNNLLKELESGRGKEVLDRIKRDYANKEIYSNEYNWNDAYFINSPVGTVVSTLYTEDGTKVVTVKTGDNSVSIDGKNINRVILIPNSLEEQQEEAIVELLSLMIAEKLDTVKDKNLISLLKQLLKRINDFIKQLLRQKELNINEIEDSNLNYLVKEKIKELTRNGTITKKCQ